MLDPYAHAQESQAVVTEQLIETSGRANDLLAGQLGGQLQLPIMHIPSASGAQVGILSWDMRIC